MQGLPVAARIYIWLIGAGGCVLAAFMMWSSGNASTSVGALMLSGNRVSDYKALLFFVAIQIVLDLKRVRLPLGANISVSTAVSFTCTLLFGPAWALVSALVSYGLTDLVLGKPWYKAFFNAGSAGIYVGISGLVYYLVYVSSDPPLGSVNNVIAVLLYASANIIVSTALVSVIVSLSRRISVWHAWVANFKSVVLELTTTIPIGILAGMAFMQAQYLGAIFFMLPLFTVLFAMQNSQRLLHQTKQTIEALADSVDKRDPYTFSHSQMVASYSAVIARRFGMNMMEIDTIISAARIHDLGKVAIPDHILQKNGPLNHEEMMEMQRHPSIGADMVANLPLYRREKDLILLHQERYDGTGYPLGISGEKIPLGARIIAVADAYQAMTSDRPYRRAMLQEVAIAQLRNGRGTQFDPQVVDVFVAVLEEDRQASPIRVSVQNPSPAQS